MASEVLRSTSFFDGFCALCEAEVGYRRSSDQSDVLCLLMSEKLAIDAIGEASAMFVEDLFVAILIKMHRPHARAHGLRNSVRRLQDLFRLFLGYRRTCAHHQHASNSCDRNQKFTQHSFGSRSRLPFGNRQHPITLS